VEAAQRVRPLPPLWQAVTLFLTAGGLFVAVNQIFSLRFFVGYTLLENRYLYLLLGSFFPQVFLLFPVGRGRAGSVPWYDVVAFLLGMATSFFFAWHGERMIREAWEFRAPPHAVGVGIVLWALLIEASRRVGGWAFALTLLLLSLYPVYAGRLPGPIAGFNLSFTDTIRYHMSSVEAILGIPMRVVGTLIIGFIVFGVVLQAAGGGLFFTRLAMALLGTARGGTAKVAILASALFGTMSGSAVANVLSTGSVTIPAMKRTGFRPEDAAAVEANASTGGLITPPVMGATAFMMASVLGIPYLNVAIAASIPAFLYFLSLFLQLDGYAARRGLQGLPRAELPSLPRTLAEGWFYLFALAALVFFLVYLRQEALAPFYASGALILLALLRRETRWTPGRLLAFLESTRGILAELVTVLAAVGLFIGALSVTGVAGTLTNDILFLAGENTLLLLVLGAVVSFVLGLALTITPAYIFLAITPCPRRHQTGAGPHCRAPLHPLLGYAVGHNPSRRALGGSRLGPGGRSPDALDGGGDAVRGGEVRPPLVLRLPPSPCPPGAQPSPCRRSGSQRRPWAWPWWPIPFRATCQGWGRLRAARWGGRCAWRWGSEGYSWHSPGAAWRRWGWGLR
jgi:TRAP transporter 4TM/12TM fusion protein